MRLACLIGHFSAKGLNGVVLSTLGRAPLFWRFWEWTVQPVIPCISIFLGECVQCLKYLHIICLLLSHVSICWHILQQCLLLVNLFAHYIHFGYSIPLVFLCWHALTRVLCQPDLRVGNWTWYGYMSPTLVFRHRIRESEIWTTQQHWVNMNLELKLWHVAGIFGTGLISLSIC